jgi:hypothetical protein
MKALHIAGLGLLLAGCGTDHGPAAPSGDDPAPAAVASAGLAAAPAVVGNPQRDAFFGDLHVHTMLSFDAYIFGTRSTPDSAYRYAKGEPLAHPSGFQMQLDQPLDFLGVTDHGLYLGMLPAMDRAHSPVAQHPLAQAIRDATTPAQRIAAFQGIRPYIRRQRADDDLLDLDIVRSAWQDTLAAAERHNDPGRFTAFAAYEYTAMGDANENLHRNVVFQGAAPALPFTALDSQNPEDLWVWMDALREQGIEALAIPHNSNGSDGLMFSPVRTDGSPMDAAYADQRMRNEPLVEVTQVKGTSETHPLLSPNDEWAGFELMETKIASVEPSRPEGSYVRDALVRGLAMEETEGFNPFRFGLVGSSDTHVGAGSFDETNYWSKVGIVDGTPAQRGSVPLPEPDAKGNVYADPTVADFSSWGASGLAGVWAEANTRESLYAAFRRKETFATSGPRIRVRLFAGYGLAGHVDSADRIARFYDIGVPMGADLTGLGSPPPEFFVWAVRDARSAPLQRLQIVKGWVADGTTHERVFDVACADGLAVDSASHRCPDNGARVNLSDCSISTGVGAAELETLWRDPEFDPHQRAFYYVRALENPTCRWSTWDAIRSGVPPRESLAPTIQERAWSSPIWYVPGQV